MSAQRAGDAWGRCARGCGARSRSQKRLSTRAAILRSRSRGTNHALLVRQ